MPDSFTSVTREVRHCLKLLAWCFLLPLSAVFSVAQEADRRSFELPADSAEKTLKLFSQQSGRTLIMDSAAVKGIRTNAVHGEFTSREALDKMLANTGLEAVYDSQSASLAIRRVNSRGNSKPTVDSGQTTGAVAGRVKNLVSGQYLNSVRVTVKGINTIAYTDQSGAFRIAGLPPGPAVIDVLYTGLDTEEIPVNIRADETTHLDIGLTSRQLYGEPQDLVRLDAFVTTASRETDANSVAVNERRFAPNIKTVVATDAFGDVLGGSVGEFLKFLPGVTVGYSGNEVTDLSIRGVGSGMTSFTTDGAPMVFATYAPATRGFNTYTSDINDASRIEVTKAPTPSSPGDSIGGSINLVSKSAFDRDRAVFRWGISAIGNSKHITLGKVPVSFGDERSHFIQPGYNFDYTLPLTKRFGIVVTGLHIIKASDNSDERTLFATGGTGTNATESAPYLKQYLSLSGPRALTRSNLSFKADWKVMENAVLSAGIKWSQNRTIIGAQYRQFDAGAVGTPLPATANPMTFGSDFTEGATGRGTVNMISAFQRFGGGTVAPSLNFRFDDGNWKIDATASYAHSKMAKDNPGGPFQGLTAALNVTNRVSFLDFSPGNAGTVEVRDNANRPIDINDINNYRITTAQEIFYNRKDEVRYGELKLRRRLNAFSFPSSIEIGGSTMVKNHEGKEYVRNLTFNGPDGVAATVDPASPYLMQTYKDGNIPWLSPDAVWSAWDANPSLLSQTAAQMVQQENTRRNGSKFIEEEVNAIYVQGEATVLNNRLRILTGVRYEKTTDRGEGVLVNPDAVWVRNPDGSFARNAQGLRIRKPEAGAANSMDQLLLTTVERGYRAERSYDHLHPSFHLTFSARENLLARFAYAKTIGRPDYGDILPTANLQEADLPMGQVGDPTIAQGTITVSNTGLKPWTAHNFDLSLELYTQSGGVVSGGVFLKEISDFFSDSSRIATQQDIDTLGLDPRYLGWMINTKFNGGDARISGVEFDLRQPLRAFGTWGRYIIVFANATRLWLDGDQQASFDTFIPKSANVGGSFSRKRIGATVKWNYRGQDRRIPVATFGADGYRYFASRATVDVDLAYRLTQRFALALNVTNIFNAPSQVWMEYGSATPHYARQARSLDAGVQFSLTLRGSL